MRFQLFPLRPLRPSKLHGASHVLVPLPTRKPRTGTQADILSTMRKPMLMLMLDDIFPVVININVP